MNSTAPKRKCSRLHLSARLSGPQDLPQFLSKTTIEAVGLSQVPVDGRLLGLPGPYHRHAIGTFNTCSRVPTPQSLTDTVGGYHIENLRITTIFSPSFPSVGSTDPPNDPARSQIIHIVINFTREGNKPYISRVGASTRLLP
jgi:hypothetical protein